MKYNNKYFFVLLITLYFFLSVKSYSQSNDSNYVTSQELEPGWGLYWRNQNEEIYETVKSILYNVSISPNGKYLAYDCCWWMGSNELPPSWGIKVLNTETKEIIFTGENIMEPFWSSDNNFLIYFSDFLPPGLSFISWNRITNKIDSINCITESCDIGSTLAPDDYFYFAFPNGYPPPDSQMYRTNLFESIIKGKIFYELIPGLKWEMQNGPIFSPNSMDYNIIRIGNEIGCVTGFYIVTNFDYKGRRSFYYQVPDTSWVISAANTAYMNGNDIALGPNGDVYTYLSFRAKSEIARDCMPPFDSNETAARNASGLYRIDTSGKNFVQLVRSWTYKPGGFSITADGETIYYGFLLSDTCAGIMKMNKYGKNKELVMRIEPCQNVIIDVPEPKQIINPVSNLTTRYNETTNEINISWKLDNSNKTKIYIYDLYGRLIEESDIGNQIDSISINAASYMSGVYFVTLRSPVMAATKGVLVLK
jgi:hypothetical protein